MFVWLLPVLGVLALNYWLWKRRGSGWRKYVDDFLVLVQPFVPEPVVDVVVLQPAGFVGRQARAEQGRGLNVILGGMSGEVSGAIAQHRADEEAAGEEVLPPMTALVLSSSRRYLLPVMLADGAWVPGPVERAWGAGDATYSLSPRAMTIQVTITLTDGSWTGHYEAVRDPAKYGQSLLERLVATG